MVTLPHKPKTGLFPGRHLSFQVADSYALYEVIKIGARTVSLKHVSGYTEPLIGKKGSCRLSLAEDMARMDDVHAEIMWEHDCFYLQLQPGTILHYANHFDQYVRCEAVRVTEEMIAAGMIDHRPFLRPPGEMALKPLGLVGQWKDWALKSDEYWVRQVKEGHLFTPNITTIYEGRTPRDGELDPRNLPLIELPA